MANKFKPNRPETDWTEGQHFPSADQAIEALKKIAPNYRCPVCSKEVFVMEEDFDGRLRTALVRYELPSIDSVNFDTMVSISCDNCGYVMSFNEDTLKRKIANRG